MAPEHSDDGVDLTLIRWMLSLTPRERLAVLQDQADSSHSVQSSKPRFLEILKVLTRHRVDFIVVGGVSAVLQRSAGDN